MMLGPANIIHAAGTKCYVSELSAIGDFGCMRGHMSIEDLIKSNENLDIFHVTSDEAKARKSMLNNIDQETDGKKLTTMADEESIRFYEAIMKFKKALIKKKKMTFEDIEKHVLHKQVVDPKELVELGFYDGICNLYEFEDKVMQHYHARTYRFPNEHPVSFMKSKLTNNLANVLKTRYFSQ